MKARRWLGGRALAGLSLVWIAACESVAGSLQPRATPSAGAPSPVVVTTPLTPSGPTTSGKSGSGGPMLPDAGGTWTAGPALPVPLGEVAGAVLDGRLYVAGGFGQPRGRISDDLLRFDPEANAWTRLAALPEPRHHASLVALDGRLHLIGGSVEGFARRANHWIYDVGTDSWSAARPLPEPRGAHAAVAVDGRIYVVGGVIPGSSLRAPTLRWDPADGSWAERAPAPTYREHLAVVALDDGSLLAIGGRGTTSLAAVERYDPEADAWSALPSLPTARGGLTAGVIAGKLHVVGGESIDPLRVFRQHEVLDLTTGRWAAGTPLEQGRHGLTSGVIDGRWYVAGGGTSPDLSVSDRLTILTP